MFSFEQLELFLKITYYECNVSGIYLVPNMLQSFNTKKKHVAVVLKYCVNLQNA